MPLLALLGLIARASAQELPEELPSARLSLSAGLADMKLGAGLGVAGSRRAGPVGVHGAAELFVGSSPPAVEPLLKFNMTFSWPFPMARRTGFMGPFLALDAISLVDDGKNCGVGGCVYYEAFTLGPVFTAVAPSIGFAWRWDDVGPNHDGVELGIGIQGYMMWDMGLIHPTLALAYRAGEDWRFEVSAERFAALVEVGRAF